MQSHAKAFEAHTGVYHFGREAFQTTVGFAVVLHENKVPYFNNLRMALVNKCQSANCLTLGITTQVDMNLRTGTAGTGITHLPEVIVLVSVDNSVGRQKLSPDSSGFVVALQIFLRIAFEYGCIQTIRI
ncbi:hypothetical protein SDC9_83108 [bioreactor metagenome]|uniref:Uncharacterized protein n=1 Tax=bioreactor metagenome TaxID=1076179 RepID=A0A644Z6P7_9ZZZZ